MVPDKVAIDWPKIESFIGFGRLEAPVVFIGMEEGLTSPEALLNDLNVRSAYASPIMDLHEAHGAMPDGDRWFDPLRAPRQPTWRVMADLMLRRNGNSAPTTAQRREYRALDLGRAHGDTLLVELLPYPSPKSDDWLYARFGRFSTRDQYQSKMLHQRQELIGRTLVAAQRKLIICYGEAHWPHYAGLFGDLVWTDVSGFRIATFAAARVLLSPHCSGRSFNTDKQLGELARVAPQ